MNLENFAESWIEDWNSHDIERIVGHYRIDAEFRSPLAEKMLGDGVVRGHDELKAYWTPALARRPGLKFHLKRAFIGHRCISIHYGDELDRKVIATIVFDESGKAIFGCGCYA
jgi:hypothetical protein